MLADNNNADSWQRLGNDKELQFFATDSEVKQWLLAALPHEFEPYSLVGSDSIKDFKKHYVEHPSRFTLGDFPECAHPDHGQRFHFWILSDRLTPNFQLTEGQSAYGICARHGLILLQHAFRFRPQFAKPAELYLDSSRIAILDRLQNLETEEIRRLDTYLPIYKALCARIKKDLVYSTLTTFADGHVEEETRIHRMTEGAVKSYAEGFRFICAPGRLLSKSAKEKNKRK